MKKPPTEATLFLVRQSHWPGNKAIDWHPRRVPSFHRLIADGAFKARDLPRLRHMLGTAINRTASACPMMRWLHPLIMRRESKLA
jgi:hypothetical protein